MQDSIKRLIESVVQYRKHLAEVESRRGQYKKNVPAEIWQQLADVSHRLEQAEENVRRTCREVAASVNQTRADITATLEEFTRWREQMRQVEDLFLANIVRPGHHLKRAIRQREYLQQEYHRILAGIQREGYASQQQLEADVHGVLTDEDMAFDAQAESPDEDLPQDEDIFETFDEVSVDDLVEAFSKEELVKEFKRVVLPKVHPDTSNTPPEVFKTVYEVYKKRDFLLMEAYIAEYQEELQLEQDADPLESLDQVLNTQRSYLRLHARLQRRVDRLKQDLPTQEMQDPVNLQEKMLQQRQEILARIRSEAEQILLWREKIEGLVKVYLDQNRIAREGK